MSRHESKQLKQQKIALGAGLFLVAAALVWLIILIQVETPDGEFVEGEHYFLLENPRRVRGNKIEIIEFFSYACPHCFNLEPELSDWEQDHLEIAKVIRSPLYSNELWELFARTWFTFEELGITEDNHYAFFAAIHSGRLNLTTAERIADWVDGKGTSKEEFLKTLTSSVINRNLREADRLQREIMVASVPTLIVQGKYLVKGTRTIGLSRMLDVVDYLITLESQPSQGEPAQSDPAQTQ